MLPAILWALLILSLLLLPGRMLPPAPFQLSDLLAVDKLVHAFIFMVLQYLLVRGFALQPTFATLRKLAMPLSFLISITFGASMEGVQWFIPDRAFEWIDMIANTVGVIVGSLVYVAWKNYAKHS